MAITEKRRSELLEYLSASRSETMAAKASYTDEQRAYLSLADMETVERCSPDGLDYTCYVFTAKNRKQHCPVHINIHGGGFFYGHKENDWFYSAYIADAIEGIVVDIDYKTTADGIVWPVPMDQCCDAADWVFDSCAGWGADPERVSIGGYSAGSTLAAATALKLAPRRRFCLAVLGYGVVDNLTPAQYKLPGFGKRMMPCARMDAFGELLTGGDEAVGRDDYLSPIFAPDELLSTMPRTLIISAGECDLRFEDERFGARLVSLGVEVTMKRVLGASHGFIPHFLAHWREGADIIVSMLNSI
jgi:acetyl esterase